jgi:3-methyl-2-oxobutanoate hydroxymethyltransferase
VIGHLNGDIGDHFALTRDAVALESAGVDAIVLKNVEITTAERITAAVGVPTIGIGSGPHCDAQIIVSYDAFCLTLPHRSVNSALLLDLAAVLRDSMEGYARAVRSGTFP